MTEHFVTLFDGKFLPQALCLSESLRRQAPGSRLWALCLDEESERALARLAPEVSPIPLRQVETDALRAAGADRTRAEYCWTLTPFTFSAVFEREPSARRVTYLDADLFFFGPPQDLLDELSTAGKSILITEHAYDPRYDVAAKHGRFCVQFLTFTREPEALRVLARWQAQCLEWCYARDDGSGRFGDQKYLDPWPADHAGAVHVLRAARRALGPWNVARFEAEGGGRLDPVFYHFHGLRIVAPRLVQLYHRYEVGPAGRALYRRYVEALSGAVKRLNGLGLPVPVLPYDWGRLGRLRRAWHALRGLVAFAPLG